MSQIAAFGVNAFSAVVDLWLEKDGERIPLTHVAPAFIRVDGKIQKHPVYLDDGMSVRGKF